MLEIADSGLDRETCSSGGMTVVVVSVTLLVWVNNSGATIVKLLLTSCV